MNFLKKFLPGLLCAALILAPSVAYAEWGIIDKLNLAPFVPLALDSLMMVATGMYEFFVGDGTGIIYMLVWGFLLFTLSMNLVKLYLPKVFVNFVGFEQGVDVSKGGVAIVKDAVMKPCVRALVAAGFLLQVKPIYMTEWLINPFLQFGAMYTSAITETINESGVATQKIDCPPGVLSKAWISQDSCEFLVQPVADLSRANNVAIQRGVQYIDSGLRGLLTMIPHGGADFMSLVTGIVLVITFFSSNLFMALLVIQGIFNFGIALALYPFSVLSYVMKPSSKWLDIWPAFAGLATAIQKLVITMIACAFILCINLAVIRAMFQWNSSMFVVAAGGAASSNIPSLGGDMTGFGGHSVLWLSAILTFYLMFRIFELTRKQLDDYVGGGMDGLYKGVTSDAKVIWNRATGMVKTVGTAVGWVKKK